MTATPSSGRPAFFDFSPRVKLKVTGADAFRFLNGQITNDLRRATETSAIQAAILNAKGKLSAHVFVSTEAGGAFVLDADPELREELPARLDRYIIADDVQLEDVTDQFSILHFIADAAPDATDGTRIVASDRFGEAGWDLWCDPASRPEFQERDGFRFCDDACAEVFRIERGIPRWGRELTDEIIPVEANLELSAIDYAKGCYIGQEVISRMKMSGQTNKRLCGLLSLSGAPLEPGMRLSSERDAGKDAGWLTSATRSEHLGKEIGLGFVKRGFNAPGTSLLAAEIPVEVTALPFG